MLIKVGDVIFDPFEVTAVSPARCIGEVCIGFRQCAPLMVRATMDEVEAALIDAGVMTDLTADHDPLPPLTDAEVEKLYALKSDGYKYLARDKDGRLYAFRHKPKYGGFYWDDPDPAPALHVDGLSFVSEEDEEPTEICSLIENLS